ncbi:MAG: hypothetical protein EP338_02405 [Bacteroidetes bacterium]|nr:MAG: hypothetical protein EP338_02405 [Bacteroidota bacterium]
MELHLLRHAKTKQAVFGERDFDRQLLPKGLRQLDDLQKHLPDMDLVNVHCSSSKRTRQSFELLAASRKFKSVCFQDELYLASGRELLAYLNEQGGSEPILLIGHNNGISDLAEMLTESYQAMKTCAYLCLDVPLDSWEMLSSGTATIRRSYRPEV